MEDWPEKVRLYSLAGLAGGCCPTAAGAIRGHPMVQEPLYQQGEPCGDNTLLRAWAPKGDFQV